MLEMHHRIRRSRICDYWQMQAEHTEWKPSGLVGMCFSAELAYQKHEMHPELLLLLKIEDTSSFFLRNVCFSSCKSHSTISNF